jgi:D-threo-aldose 1-dehydrogenase
MRHDSRVKLGRTSLAVTRLGFGATAIGGMYEQVPDSQGHAAVDAAWNNGIRLFDAAPQYGLGLGELRLGEGLAGRPRDEYVLSSKVGRLLRADAPPNPDDFGPDGEPFDKGTPAVATVYDYSRDGVLASIEESLVRLKQDRLDIVYVHDPDNYVSEALDGAFPALIELREQGVIGAVGAGMNQTEALETFARNSDPDVFLCAGRYTLLEQGALDSFLPLCEERGISVVVGGAYNSGLLADPNPGTHYNYLPAPPELIERARRLAAVCERHGVPLKAAAIQFPSAHPAVAAVLTGARRPSELDENCALFDRRIPGDLWRELRAEGLLDERAPVPASEPASHEEKADA